MQPPEASVVAEPITSLTREEVARQLAEAGQPAFRGGQLLDWVYRKRVRSFEAMSNLPSDLRTFLAGQFSLGTIETVRRLGSHDTTQKFLFRLSDGQLIETVLIPASPALYGEASDRRTLCISTQVGCAYGCKFCASGLDGWTRNLRAGEIVEQILRVEESGGETGQQHRVHGHGRAARQLRPAPARHRYHQRPVGRSGSARVTSRCPRADLPRRSGSWRSNRCRSGSRSHCTGRPMRFAPASCR